jgi:hypothetical protein
MLKGIQRLHYERLVGPLPITHIKQLTMRRRVVASNPLNTATNSIQVKEKYVIMHSSKHP